MTPPNDNPGPVPIGTNQSPPTPIDLKPVPPPADDRPITRSEREHRAVMKELGYEEGGNALLDMMHTLAELQRRIQALEDA